METQSSLELKNWQEDILQMYGGLEIFDLKPKQKRMIEELLFPTDSNPFWVELKYKRILERVLNYGFYSEGDREALNLARECYLRGKNWIK